MTNQEFQAELNKYRILLKPQLYEVLVTVTPAFTDETKEEIVKQLRIADSQMKDFVRYEQKRIGILQAGLNKINEIYSNAKEKFQKHTIATEEADRGEAGDLISNL